MQFDGGSSGNREVRQGIGTAGFVICDGSQKEIIRKGCYLGPANTVNDAEANALVLALKELQALQAY